MVEHERPRIFYDGLCPLCLHEVKLLRRLDTRGVVVFTDITAADFRAEDFGLLMEDLMGSIHGINRQGQTIQGLAVFREIYAAIGYGWVWSWTAWPLIAPVADMFYKFFAKVRPRLSSFDHGCQERCDAKQTQR